jgi:hypothetical protein
MIFTEASLIPGIGEPPTRSRGKTGSMRRCCPGYLNLLVTWG